jgi:hypothetical protein
VIYSKHGRSVRRENGRVITVTESGWAREQARQFECAPLDESWDVPFQPVVALPRLPALPDGVSLERAVISWGLAEHRYGDRHWTTETRQLHCSLTRGRLRVLIDSTWERIEEIDAIANALQSAQSSEREAPPRLRLAPNVTAAFLPVLRGLVPPNVRLRQTGGAIDAYGQPVEEEGVHFYRPSYRVRPVRADFDLRLECPVEEIDRDRPIAMALLAPVRSPELAVLVRDGEQVYPCRVRVNRIDAVSSERVWYPYGAGSFGAELML